MMQQWLKNSGKVMGNGTRAGFAALGRGWQRLWCSLANARRRVWRKQIPDYVVIPLDHAISERAPSVPWWYAYIPTIKLPLSLEYLHDALERIAGDPDVQGVIFVVKGPSLGLAKAQSLVQLLARFRRWDAEFRLAAAPSAMRQPKQIIVHLEDAGAAALVLASAADKIVMTPLSTWSFAGLRLAPLYLKETLARIGVKFDVVNVAPWKAAYEPLQRSRMSPENRDQQNWLLDSLYTDIVEAIATGRNLSFEQVEQQIDLAPLLAQDALAGGLIDAVLYEDELPRWLGAPDQPAKLALYSRMQDLLYRRPRARHAKAIGVLSLEGSIVSGESRRYPIPLPLVGDRLMGSRTAANQIRAARKDRRLAAVVLHVDSGGGSALASDIIWREIKLLAQEKPLIVYLGDVAASGGYYIATPGQKIVAQSATLTGSIGVIIAKPVTGEAADRLGANREVIQRGRNADLYTEDSPWTEPQRAKIDEGVQHVYHEFKVRVAEGRGLPLDGLDDIANGRVWTGKQALAHHLVDTLGDFQTALKLACQAAKLPHDGSVRTVAIAPPRTRQLAEPAHSPTARLGATAMWPLSQAVLALVGGEWEALLGRERYWLWADGLPRIRE